MKIRGFLVLWLLLLLPVATKAVGEAYSFPRAGVRVSMRDGWSLMTQDMLFEKADDLAGQGIDVKQLRLDMQASGAVFAIFMGDVRVTLSRHENERTAAFSSTDDERTQADRDALLDAYSAPPYQNAVWVQENEPHLTFDWALQSDGETRRFSGAALVWEGALYQLTATGPAPVDVLREANERVLSASSFFAATAPEDTTGDASSFVPILDDGVAVPLDLIDFTGLSYEDTTDLVVQTLPDAEVVVVTPNDRLRALADETGRRTFRVSTRREMVYEYTISVSLPDRKTTEAEIAVNRQLSPEMKMDAYRRQARVLDGAFYAQLLSPADEMTDTAVSTRGTVAQFHEWRGFPCALVYSENADGERRYPLFVALTEPFAIKEGSSYAIYADILAETMPFVNDDGIETEAPVLRARFIQP